MLVTSLSFAIFAGLTSETLIRIFAGNEYTRAADLFTLLLWSRVLESAGVVFYYTILASKKQRLLLWLALVSMITSVSSLFILLPRVGLIGSGISVLLVTALTILLLGWLKETRVLITDWLVTILRPGLVGLFVWFVLRYWHAPVLVTWTLGPLLYAAILFLTGELDHKAVKPTLVAIYRSISGR